MKTPYILCMYIHIHTYIYTFSTEKGTKLLWEFTRVTKTNNHDCARDKIYPLKFCIDKLNNDFDK